MELLSRAPNDFHIIVLNSPLPVPVLSKGDYHLVPGDPSLPWWLQPTKDGCEMQKAGPLFLYPPCT